MKSYAQIAYEAYCEHRRWKSFRDEPLPQWSEVLPEIKEAWDEAATAVITELDNRRDDEEG